MSPIPTTEIEAHIDLGASTIRAGTAYMSTRRGVLSVTFTYDQVYLGRAGSRAISPDLPLDAGTISTTGLPGALADSAPDRWGRNLINKRLRAAEDPAERGAVAVGEIDYLLGVADISRQGDLRYRIDGGPFLQEDVDVPQLIELPRLLDASNLVARDLASDDEMAAIKVLLDAGSGSLGGARPKASVRADDQLLIAKFPHPNDPWSVIAWEKTALDLAELSGIRVPNRRLEAVGEKQVLLLDRFDRDGDHRLGYLSAMSLLVSQDGDNRDYLELAEALSTHGSNVDRDLEELWRRIAFSVVINNTDDHLRNHGFLYQDAGWTLSPVFDVNPNPDLSVHRSTSINYETEAIKTPSALFDAAEYFGINRTRANEIWNEVRTATAPWRDVAKANGVAQREINLFAAALDAHNPELTP
jgi:serine/threonine-protein kinase HipA